MSEHIIKISGSSNLESGLELDKNYRFYIDGDILSVKKEKDQTGGYDYIYTAKQITCEVIQENGEAITSKDKMKRSEALRRRIYLYWKDNGAVGDQDTFYEKTMNRLIGNLDEVMERMDTIDLSQ